MSPSCNIGPPLLAVMVRRQTVNGPIARIGAGNRVTANSRPRAQHGRMGAPLNFLPLPHPPDGCSVPWVGVFLCVPCRVPRPRLGTEYGRSASPTRQMPSMFRGIT
eukprot:5206644-Prymnesium_polylepis.1